MMPTNAADFAARPRRRAHRLVAALLLGLGVAACSSGPPQPIFTVDGTLRDAAGQPIAGAVVSDGTASTLSDEAGGFSLGVFRPEVGVVKPGFERSEWSVSAGKMAPVTLEATDVQPRVGIDGRWGGQRLTGLGRALAKLPGTSVRTYTGGSLDAYDVLFLVTPGALAKSEREALKAWVRQGNRLVLAGEWGGYPEQDLDALNELAEGAGIRFTGATVKSVASELSEEWFSVEAVAPASLGRLVAPNKLYLYTTTSLSLSGAARSMIASDRQSYSVLATRTAPQCLAALGPMGLGKVFALGDSSLWVDEDSEGTDVPNWQRGGNLQLAEALLRW